MLSAARPYGIMSFLLQKAKKKKPRRERMLARRVRPLRNKTVELFFLERRKEENRGRGAAGPPRASPRNKAFLSERVKGRTMREMERL